MYTFDEIQALVASSMEQLDWTRSPKGLYEPIGYCLSLGGKRVRPCLCLMAADMFGGNLETVIPAAQALEVFHNFTLLHDDVMDHADIRRGKPCVHVRWDENTAILSGDAMTIEAYKCLARLKAEHLATVLPWFNQMAIEICEGQQYDVEFEKRDDVTRDQYIEMIRLKTAVLLATALKIGAYLAGASADDQQHLYQFGINLGLAFQLQDDYLDVYGDPATFGKAIGGDILCNKKTWMLLSALQQADNQSFETLKSAIHGELGQGMQKIDAVTRIYTQLGIHQQAQQKMEEYYQLALQDLAAVSVSDQQKQVLLDLAQKLLKRNK